MAVLLCLFVTAQAEPERAKPLRPVSTERLVWLAKHQLRDGSWGPGRGCECFDRTVPPAVPRDPDVEKKMKPLLEALASDSLEERDRAMRGIGRLGRAALPWLEDAAASKDEEARGRAREIIDTLKTLESAEDVEATSLVVLAMACNGTSHLSRDEHDGVVLGAVVKSAFKWLAAQQAADGCVGPRPIEGVGTWNALAAYALTEMYGMTTTQLLREPSNLAIAWLASRQNESGAWGPGVDDPATTFWSVLALASSEVEAPEATKRGLEWYRKRAATGSDADVAAYVGLARMTDSKADVSALVERLSKITPRADDPLAYFQTALALRLADDGRRWSEWRERHHKPLVERWRQGPPTCEKGERRATALLTCVLLADLVAARK